jgi:hypothetical protein
MNRFAILAALAAGAGAPARDETPIVHEWGTFTTVAGADGRVMRWHPFTPVIDLPSFVYDNRGQRKRELDGTVRMETPILYFYSDREATLSVKVAFPKGIVTEWFPAAANDGTTIEWPFVQVLPSATTAFPRDGTKNHYYAARETDAAPVRVRQAGGEELERFLFYRGVGTFDLPLSARLDGETLRVRNLGAEEIAKVIVFESRGGKVGYRIHSGLKEEARIERPTLDGRLEDVLAELRSTLVAQDLYAKEARAMVETWRDAWFEEGLRVFYVVPRRLTDAVLPIAIEPRPRDLVRVLVGRFEILAPETERSVTELVLRPGASMQERVASLRRLGRFARPMVERVLASAKGEAERSRIGELLDAL